MKTKVSIIVPVYNVEKYIEKCLDSLINQSYKNVEIVVINDGSTDNSINIIMDKYNSNDRIYIYNKKNGGLSSARNLGLDKATGDYLLFVDSDDWLELDCVEKLVDVIESQNADIIEFGYKMVSDCKELSSTRFTTRVFESNNSILEEFFFGTQIIDIVCNKIYKKKLFDNVRFVEGKIHEDYMITPELLYNCNKFIIVDHVFYNYYQRSDSITQKPFSEKNFDRIFAGKHVADFCKKNINQFYEIALIRIGFICIYLYKHLLDSSKQIKKEEYIKYKKRISNEYIEIYKKMSNSLSLKKLPIYKRIMFKMFKYSKNLTVGIYRLLRS